MRNIEVSNKLYDQEGNDKQRRNDDVFKELQEMEYRIIRKINATKRSLEYDLNKKFENLKHSIVMQNNINRISMTEARSILEKEMPIKNIQEFNEFDESLIDDDNKQNALVSYVLNK